MTYYRDWPKDLDNQNTTYKSQGVHKNRDTTAKMQLEPMDRDGFTDSQKQAAMADAATPEIGDSRPQGMAPDEPVRAKKANKDISQEVTAKGHEATHAFTETVKAGGLKPPIPGSGTQASYGDGVPQGQGGGGMSIDAEFSYSGGEGGSGFSGSVGGFGFGGGGGGSGGGSGGGMSSAGAAQLGQDIAAMDDEIDQATEILFQDDTDVKGHFALGEKLQGR